MSGLGFGLLPPRCGACGRTGPSPCIGCRPFLAPAPPLDVPPPLASLSSLLRYEGGARRLVLGIKARHERSAIGWLADGLSLLLPSEVDLLTWPPTSRARAARRGCDHARLLAEAVGRRSGIRAHATLTRGPGPAQQGRSRADRVATGPVFVPLFALDGLAVVVVDDVVTTGATLSSAGRTLMDAGAVRTHGLAVAATPEPPAPGHSGPHSGN